MKAPAKIDGVKHLTDITRIHLDAEHVIVCEVEAELNAEAFDKLGAHLKTVFPGHQIVILGWHMVLTVVRRPYAP